MSEEKAVSPKMKYVYFGRTGLRVSELCLGAMTFGRGASLWGPFPVIGDEESFEILDKFVEYGGNFIDTANIYSVGESESILGNWMEARENRDSIVLATKVRHMMGPGPNDSGLSRKHILKSVDDSLRRLKTDYIDLLQVHSWDDGTPLEETLSALNDLVRSGKVRYVGASNFAGWQIHKALRIAEKLGFEQFVSLQAQYSLLCRSPELELFPASQDAGLVYMPWSPLKGGWLTGRYTREGGAPDSGRVAWAEKAGWQATNYSSLATDLTWDTLDKLKEIADARGKSISQVALRWTMQKNPQVPTIPIIGARKMTHLEDNLGAAFFELTDDEMEALNKVSDTPWPYPYDLLRPGGPMYRGNPNLKK